MAEVAKHNTIDSVWICYHGKAYDITTYMDKHPGGRLPIENMAGKDSTDVFDNYHPEYVVKKILPSFYLGDIVDYEVSEFVKEH